MTVIRPNSVSGITSITAQANDINFFRSNGTLAGLNLNGVNFNTTSGISTFAALNIEGVLTYQDVTNVDSVGIITARSGINVSGGQLTVTSSSKDLLYLNSTHSDGPQISIQTSGTTFSYIGGAASLFSTGSSTDLGFRAESGKHFIFGIGSSEKLRITTAGRVGINQTTPQAMLQVDYDYNSSEVGLRLRAATGSGTKTWQLSEINGNAGVFTIRNTSNGYNILNIDGANQRVGINKTNPEQELHVVGDSDACVRLTCTDGGVASFQLGDASDTVIGGLTLNAADNSIQLRGNNNSERVRIESGGNVVLKRGGISATPSVKIFGSGNASDTAADDFTIHNWGDSDGDYWRLGVNCGMDANGNDSKPSNTLKGAAITIDGRYGRVFLQTSPSSSSTVYDTLIADSGGRVTKPQTPFVMVHIQTTSNRNSTSGYFTIPWDIIHLRSTSSNVGSHFNTSNHRFTAPIAGRYFFCMSLNIVGDNIVKHRINGSDVSQAEYRSQDDNQWDHADASFIYDMNANDYYDVVSSLTGSGQRWNGGSNGTTGWDTLSIYLLG